MNARRRDGKLLVAKLAGKARARALELAHAYVSILEAHVGAAREEIEPALASVPASASERKLSLGLRKLLDDACGWETEPEFDAATLRGEVFRAAAEARRSLGDDVRFDRDALLASIAAARGLDVDAVERGLFADLRSASRLLRAPETNADALVDAYDDGQAQAILLRAVRLDVRVDCATASEARTLFRKLKFLRLLHRVEPREGEANGYTIAIDGPFAMFEASTKYGLQLAMLLPALRECRAFSLAAELRWGKAREPLSFETSGGWGAAKEPSKAPAPLAPLRRGDATKLLPDDVAQLLERFRALESSWSVDVSTDLLELPGVGLCVPDLVFVHATSKRRVHLEVLGFWSRDAVWKRVELVRAGLPFRVLFAVSARLRVSEEVLDEELPSALYVYKGAMNARAVRERLDALG